MVLIMLPKENKGFVKVFTKETAQLYEKDWITVDAIDLAESDKIYVSYFIVFKGLYKTVVWC